MRHKAKMNVWSSLVSLQSKHWKRTWRNGLSEGLLILNLLTRVTAAAFSSSVMEASDILVAGSNCVDELEGDCCSIDWLELLLAFLLTLLIAFVLFMEEPGTVSSIMASCWLASVDEVSCCRADNILGLLELLLEDWLLVPSSSSYSSRLQLGLPLNDLFWTWISDSSRVSEGGEKDGLLNRLMLPFWTMFNNSWTRGSYETIRKTWERRNSDTSLEILILSSSPLSDTSLSMLDGPGSVSSSISILPLLTFLLRIVLSSSTRL